MKYPVSIVAVVVLLIAGCNSERTIARKNNKFLLSQRIDTIHFRYNELEIADSNIVKNIDTFIRVTEKLPQYDSKLLPNFRIRFGHSREDSSVCVMYEIADNGYLNHELLDLYVEDTVLSKNPSSGVLKYKGYKIFVAINEDCSNLRAEMAVFFKPAGKITTIDSYLFYSTKYKKYLRNPIWINTLEYKRIGNKYIFSKIDHTNKLMIR